MIEFLNAERNTISIESLVDIQLMRLRQQMNTKTTFNAIHVGAYTGNIDIDFMAKNSDVVVHAIEPCKRNFRYLKQASEHFQNLQAHKLLIADSDGEGILYVNAVNSDKPGEERASSQSNSMFRDFADPKEAEEKAEVTVQQLTLQRFIRSQGLRRIDYLRLNCEGAEYKIFAPGQSLKFLSKTNIVAITIHGKHRTFFSDEYVKLRLQIETEFKAAGLVQIYGHSFSSAEKLPVGHVWQVWTRQRFVLC